MQSPIQDADRPLAAQAAAAAMNPRPAVSPQPVGSAPLPEVDMSRMNWLQRQYFAWALPKYAVFTPEQRADVIAFDLWLYSRRSLGALLGLFASMAGIAVGLVFNGVHPVLAVLSSVVLWSVLLVTVMTAWFAPDGLCDTPPRRWSPMTPRRQRPAWDRALRFILGGYLGGLVGYTFARCLRTSDWSIGNIVVLVRDAILHSMPVAIAGVATVIGVALLVSWIRRRQLQQRLQAQLREAELAAQRDAAARAAAEARLKVLQAQIQPHFLFNTLAALQYWVDAGDSRAGPLLRELTQFLRASTQLLGREDVTVAEEATLAQRYLTIMQARMGQRLQFEVVIDPEPGACAIPPGILLTLVENAVEHGVAGALSGGRITLKARAEGRQAVLEVLNSGSPLPAPVTDGTGLANTRERLERRFGEAASLFLGTDEDGQTVARITLRGALR
ncbi:MAG TPA: histidine kinase [Burkholderiaceae bacterium]|nr:histidine kinase [Burkholderiaceae bacterium]